MRAEWKYHVESLSAGLRAIKPEELEARLNEACEEGWELVQISPQTNSNRLYIVWRRSMVTKSRRTRFSWS
jgi:hypothetical protein